MSTLGISNQFKELIAQEHPICSKDDIDTYLAYGLLFESGKDKYVTRDNIPVNISVVKPSTFNLDFSNIIQIGEKLSEEHKIKKVYFMNERCYNNYKDEGLIVTKKGVDYYRLFANDEWLVQIVPE